jgi:integrase
MDPYAAPSVGLDRNEVGALLVAAGLGTPAEHALISLLAINWLRNSEALGADIDKLGLERRHRTQTVFREGGKIVTIQLAPRTARAIDLAIGERLEGPIFQRADGERMDRHCARRIVRRVARRAGLGKKISPHTLRHAFITAALDAGVSASRRAGSSLGRRPTHHHASRQLSRLPRRHPAGAPLTSSPSGLPPSQGQVGKPTSLASGRRHTRPARQPNPDVAV